MYLYTCLALSLAGWMTIMEAIPLLPINTACHMGSHRNSLAIVTYQICTALTLALLGKTIVTFHKSAKEIR